MSTLAALLFDVDGTLADTEEVHRLAFNKAFSDAGLPWEWSRELYTELLAVTGGRERILHFMNLHAPDFPRPDNLPEWIADLHRAKTAVYTHMLSDGSVPLRTGVKRLIMAARGAGLRMAITTTTSPTNVTALLEHSLAPDSAGWFEVIAAGNVVPAKKPAPDIYLYALERLGLRADQCLSFEDSENGIRSSLGAGVATIVTVNDYTRDHDFSGAALLLNHLGEPDRPFTVLAGDAGDAHWVGIDLLHWLHARQYA